MVRWLVAGVHLASLALGFGSNVGRYAALREPFTPERRERLFWADNASGLVAITWLGSGLWRAFGGLEKGTEYYLHNAFFQAKMLLLVLLLVLECVPMVTFIRWRYALARGEDLVAPKLKLLRVCILVEMVATVLLVFCASGMAQGLGNRVPTTGYPAVRTLVQNRCVACHNQAVRQGGMDLSTDPRAALVDVASAQWPGVRRVVPGDPQASLLLQKLRGTQGSHGQQMPPGGALSREELALVEAWITSGAKAE